MLDALELGRRYFLVLELLNGARLSGLDLHDSHRQHQVDMQIRSVSGRPDDQILAPKVLEFFTQSIPIGAPCTFGRNGKSLDYGIAR